MLEQIPKGGYTISIYAYMHICIYVPRYLGIFNEKTPLNRQSQILVISCGVSIQRQWPAMLADCAQILIWLSVSRDKAPNDLI